MKFTTTFHLGLGAILLAVAGCQTIEGNVAQGDWEQERVVVGGKAPVFKDVGITFQGDAIQNAANAPFEYKLVMYEHRQDTHGTWHIDRDNNDQPISRPKAARMSIAGEVDVDGDGTSDFDMGLIDISPAQYGVAKASTKNVDCANAFSLVFVDDVSHKIKTADWQGEHCFVEIQATGSDTGVSVTIFPKSGDPFPDGLVKVPAPSKSGMVNREFVNLQDQTAFTPSEIAENMAENWQRNPGGDQRESYRNGCLKNARTNRWSDIQSHYYCLFDYPLRQCYSEALIENLYHQSNRNARLQAAKGASSEEAALAIIQRTFAKQAIQAGAAAMNICFKQRSDLLNRFGRTDAEIIRGLRIFSTIMLSHSLSHNLALQYDAINQAYERMGLTRPRRLADWIDPRGVSDVVQPRHLGIIKKQLEVADSPQA